MSSSPAVPEEAEPSPVLLVTGLSGAGKSSILHALEDLGFEAIDNPPLHMLETLIGTGPDRRRLAVGVDCRTRGFNAEEVVQTLARLRRDPGLRPELIFAWAEDSVLQRRYTETRRRHPLSPHGRVAEGITKEQALTAPLREAADLVVDTSDLPLPALRQLIEVRYGGETGSSALEGLSVSLVSFAFPAGLPREADMVFDARFLRNPHYVQALRPLTGRDAAVGEHIAADPDFSAFFGALTGLLGLVLPRFVREGKKYATIAIGCTGGRHRSVYLVERLASHLTQAGWHVTTTHRELLREKPAAPSGPATSGPVGPGPAQEA